MTAATRTPAPSSPHRYVSLPEAAEYLSTSPRTVRRLISDGVVTGYCINKRLLRVDLNEIDAALRRVPTVGSAA